MTQSRSQVSGRKGKDYYEQRGREFDFGPGGFPVQGVSVVRVVLLLPASFICFFLLADDFGVRKLLNILMLIVLYLL